MTRVRRRNAISMQFAARLIPMLEGVASQSKFLSRAAHEFFARLEIEHEHRHHGGVENGALARPLRPP